LHQTEAKKFTNVHTDSDCEQLSNISGFTIGPARGMMLAVAVEVATRRLFEVDHESAQAQSNKQVQFSAIPWTGRAVAG
jgi:hypothetical protein